VQTAMRASRESPRSLSSLAAALWAVGTFVHLYGVKSAPVTDGLCRI
jgi:hypothetical protein